MQTSSRLYAGRRVTCRLVVPHVDRHPEHRTLDLARVNRPSRVAADEAAADVGTSRDRREVQVALDGLIHVFETSATSGEPVEQSCEALDRRCVSRGTTPALREASMNFADVPKNVMSSSSTRSHRRSAFGWKGEPSYSTKEAPTRAPTPASSTSSSRRW